MNGLNEAEALDYILSRIEPKTCPALGEEIPRIIRAFLVYDLQFMGLSGVLGEDGESGEESYDEDEALEYIYDQYLAAHRPDEDAAMEILTLLNRYQELQYEYFQKHGLAET